MTEAGDGGYGYEGSDRRQKRVLEGEILGDRWKAVVEEHVLKPAAERTRTRMDAGEIPAEDTMVRIPIVLYASIARDRGVSVHCLCSTFQDEDGTVCVCSGHCEFDACCDSTGPARG